MNTRGIKILKYLLENSRSNIKELADNFDTTVRTIYYDIDRIDYRLKKAGLKGIHKENKELSLHLEDIKGIKEFIKEEPVFSPKERILYLSIKLLYKGMIKLGKEAEILQINRKSIEGDMKELKKIFKADSVDVISLPGKGIIFQGKETSVRFLLIKSLYVAYMKKNNLRAAFKELMEEIYEGYKPEKTEDIIYEISKKIQINTNNFTFWGFIVILLAGKIREGKYKGEDIESELEISGYDFIDDILKKYDFKVDELSRCLIKKLVRDSSYGVVDFEDKRIGIAKKFIEEFRKFNDSDIWSDEAIKALVLKLNMVFFKSKNSYGYEADYFKKDLPENLGPLYETVRGICEKLFGNLMEEDIVSITSIIYYAQIDYTRRNQKILKVLVVDSFLGRYIVNSKLKSLKKIMPMEVLNIIPSDNIDKYFEKEDEKIDMILSFERCLSEDEKSRIGIPVIELNPFLPEKSVETLRKYGFY